MKRIFFAIPLFYYKEGFWRRDSGLVVLALRKMGYDAWLVTLNDPAKPLDDEPVMRISLEEMNSPEWWKGQRPDAVVLNCWGHPRYNAIRQAALASTTRVIERLDTDGLYSARSFSRLYLIRTWADYWDRLPAQIRWLAAPLAFARFLIDYLFPWRMASRLVATMRRLPQLIVESPVAAERIERIKKAASVEKLDLRVIPHPVNDDILHYDGMPKENQIISVGRWATAQKDFPTLRKVLKEFLQQHPDWRACIVGGGVPAKYRSHPTAAEDWEQRIAYHEGLSHEELKIEYGRSKIYLMVSRYESFCIAAGEALCCGCSVIGSQVVSTSTYFAETESGTVAATRTPRVFIETLNREVESWEQGKRHPETIASIWRARAGARPVAVTTLQFLASLSP